MKIIDECYQLVLSHDISSNLCKLKVLFQENSYSITIICKHRINEFPTPICSNRLWFMTNIAEHNNPDPIIMTCEQFQHVFYAIVAKNDNPFRKEI